MMGGAVGLVTVTVSSPYVKEDNQITQDMKGERLGSMQFMVLLLG